MSDERSPAQRATDRYRAVQRILDRTQTELNTAALTGNMGLLIHAAAKFKSVRNSLLGEEGKKFLRSTGQEVIDDPEIKDARTC